MVMSNKLQVKTGFHFLISLNNIHRLIKMFKTIAPFATFWKISLKAPYSVRVCCLTLCASENQLAGLS